MFNICQKCGEYRVDKTILADESVAVCPVCGFRQEFLMLPLFIVTGASCTGKSTVALEMAAKQDRVVVMEADTLWRAEFDQPENNYRDFRETWLRLCKNIGQVGKPVALFGSGIPAHYEQCTEIRYFSTIHYIALVCADAEIEKRLRKRPIWRGSGTNAFVEQQVEFNRWLIANATETEPPISLVDTSTISIDDTVKAVRLWIDERINL